MSPGGMFSSALDEWLCAEGVVDLAVVRRSALAERHVVQPDDRLALTAV
jgi:hypothetical protein